MPPSAAILDIDGTLVDSNYQHALAWSRAFREHGVTVPIWVIHRHVGMGGDKLVGAVAGEEVEARAGDEIREAESGCYQELIGEVVALPGARELVAALVDRGLRVVLASSAKEHEVEHYIDLLTIAEIAHDWTTSADVDETKPAPDLVEAALAKAGTREAVMVGDTSWDAESAARAGIPAIGVLSGGFGAQELLGAGVEAVFASPADLLERLDATPFGRS